MVQIIFVMISMFATSLGAQTIPNIEPKHDYTLEKITAPVSGTIKECGDYFRLRLRNGRALKKRNLYLSFLVTLSESPRKIQLMMSEPEEGIMDFVRDDGTKSNGPIVHPRINKGGRAIVTIFISNEEYEKVLPCLVYDPSKKIAKRPRRHSGASFFYFI